MKISVRKRKNNEIDLQEFFDNVLLFTNPNAYDIVESFDVLDEILPDVRAEFDRLPEVISEILYDFDTEKIIRDKLEIALNESGIRNPNKKKNIFEQVSGIGDEIKEKIQDEFFLASKNGVFKEMADDLDISLPVSDREIMKAAVEKLLLFLFMFPKYKIKVSVKEKK